MYLSLLSVVYIFDGMGYSLCRRARAIKRSLITKIHATSLTILTMYILANEAAPALNIALLPLPLDGSKWIFFGGFFVIFAGGFQLRGQKSRVFTNA